MIFWEGKDDGDFDIQKENVARGAERVRQKWKPRGESVLAARAVRGASSVSVGCVSASQ